LQREVGINTSWRQRNLENQLLLGSSLLSQEAAGLVANDEMGIYVSVGETNM
jgi:hypothetical protein